jgi:acyl-coenzyme A thioesterase PaaI-like protein
VPLAVTTSLTMNFLRKPALGDVLADARLLKVGKALAFGEILLRSEGEDKLVAHCTSTYSIPPGVR